MAISTSTTQHPETTSTENAVPAIAASPQYFAIFESPKDTYRLSTPFKTFVGRTPRECKLALKTFLTQQPGTATETLTSGLQVTYLPGSDADIANKHR